MPTPPQFVVLYAGGIPASFTTNHCGFMFELCSLQHCTRFETERAATEAAVKAGIRNFSVKMESELLPSFSAFELAKIHI